MTNKTIPHITIYRGFDHPNRHVWSPFVNKLETRLRFASLPYTPAIGSMSESPRGKLPYISLQTPDGNIELLSDTTLITRHLLNLGLIKDLNANLTPAQKAQDLAIRAMLEDRLVFFQMRERWVDNYYTMRDGVMASLPAAVRFFVGQLAYRGVVKTLWGQGVGRFTKEEARGFKREVWDGLEGLLEESRGNRTDGDGDEPFWILGGEEPTEADATVYAFVVAGLICEAAPETREMVRGLKVVREYVRRVRGRYFAEYEGLDEGV